MSEPIQDCSELHEAEEGDGELVVASGHAADAAGDLKQSLEFARQLSGLTPPPAPAK